MDSPKARTNKRWTSSAAHREGWERIYGKKKPRATEAEVDSLCDAMEQAGASNEEIREAICEKFGWTEEQYQSYVQYNTLPS